MSVKFALSALQSERVGPVIVRSVGLCGAKREVSDNPADPRSRPEGGGGGGVQPQAGGKEGGGAKEQGIF